MVHRCYLVVLAFLFCSSGLFAQNRQLLEVQLKSEPLESLAKMARQNGDASRGALLFFKRELNCAKCHLAKDGVSQLGPELEKLGEQLKNQTDSQQVQHIIESLLKPSAKIREGYQTISLTDLEGKQLNQLLVKETDSAITYRDLDTAKTMTVKKDDLDDWKKSTVSVMPEGLVNQLQSKTQFYDLVKYIAEITKGGPERAVQLRPIGISLEPEPLPEYEARIDHAGMLRSLNQQSVQRGKKIYQLNCQSCHGNATEVGSMPTSLRFVSGQFKRGGDPYSMYQTLTHGYSMMVAQRHLVPQQKYDVIHYIREEFVKKKNPKQYQRVTDEYLAKLPKGTTRGPKPVDRRPWQEMNYGPMMMNTFELGKNGKNFAYKGIAIQLDDRPDGIANGKHWILYDHDTMRVSAAWSGNGFIDWHGIHFDGRHNTHPRLTGEIHFNNPAGPGWANPTDQSFDEKRLVGRDKRLYGPLPREWAQFRGVSNYGKQTVIHYTVGNTKVAEVPLLSYAKSAPVFERVFDIGSRSKPMLLQVLNQPGLKLLKHNDHAVMLVSPNEKAVKSEGADSVQGFDGSTAYVVESSKDIDMEGKDFTIVARIKTRKDGTIFAKAPQRGNWCPDGKTLFVRGGRLVFDIGWVGAVTSRKRINNRWHIVALTWRKSDGRVQLFIDGKLDKTGELSPEGRAKNLVAKIGFTNNNFPGTSFFDGQISNVAFSQSVLTKETLQSFKFKKLPSNISYHWNLSSGKRQVKDSVKQRVALRSGGAPKPKAKPVKVVAVSSTMDAAKFVYDESGNLRLKIPAGEGPIRFKLFHATAENQNSGKEIAASFRVNDIVPNIETLTRGGPQRWPETFTTKIETKFEQGPFAVDYLNLPKKKPWNCRMRLTGFDFFSDPNKCAVCSWDGSVWLVTGLQSKDKTLTWKRIATGLFQPLGLRIIDEKIYCTCRDQLVKLHDLNNDDEIDFFECINNDHQVTEHFHEFAMGLQTDAEGNFYYAKSARHAKKPLVPHHGTLLRISKDGRRTDILAYGFRAANGVCINPDGSFIVTDQEGHWNPKNRINWVKPGGFYGNMWGYHDVTDSSDEKMDKPLCWITNSFDRSPAELLWVQKPAKWGALNGSLLNFSYGYGKIYVVPHENVGGQMQGGMCALPIPQFPTGVMRGRFSPADGQLYCCGMFAWAGSQTRPGGFYRVRYTGRPVHLPKSLQVKAGVIEVKFSDQLDESAAEKLSNYHIKTWHIKRTANYGSKHFNEKRLEIQKVELADDKKTVRLRVKDVKPTRCMEIKFELKSSKGVPVFGVIHNTIHKIGK